MWKFDYNSGKHTEFQGDWSLLCFCLALRWSLAGPFCGSLSTPQSLPNRVFSFRWSRAYAEDSVRHGPRAEAGEKVKLEEEEESSSSEGRRAVASGNEEAPQEGKKKKRSGFRDRKVPNGASGRRENLLWTCLSL